MTAYRRGAGPLPDWVPADVDHIGWIRLITDACHNLPVALRPSVGAGRKYRATAALRYLWATSGEVQVRWIQEVLVHPSIPICGGQREDAVRRSRAATTPRVQASSTPLAASSSPATSWIKT
jgi:hypothetical protein